MDEFGLVNTIFISLILLFGLISLITGGILIIGGFFGFRKRVNNSLNMTLEVVKVVSGKKRHEGQNESPEGWKEEIAGMEQFLSSVANMRRKTSLLGKYPPVRLALEMANPSNSEEISFYVAFPKRYKETVEKQVHSFYPDAVVEAVPDYTIFNPGSVTSISVLKLKRTQALPVRTYEEMDIDPLNEVSNAISKLQTVEEGASLQLIIEPAKGSWRKQGREIAHKMQQGKRLESVYNGNAFIKFLTGFGQFFGDLLGAFFYKKEDRGTSREQEHVQLTPEEQELVKAIERKTSKAAFSANIRLLASADTKERADQIMAQMENAFGQFERSDINYFTVKKRANEKRVVYNYIMRSFQPYNAFTLGVEELASIFHFPISTTQTPKIKWLKSGSAPPPINIPQDGGVVLGYNDYRGHVTPIRLSDGDRRRHLYTIGQTGTGKSVFLQEMAKQDVRNGHGMCFIDPHGDAIEEILSCVPKERIEDVINFDPSDVERSIGLNMLEFERPEEKTFVINEMINIFDKLYDLKSTGGPMFEQYMRNAMLLIMEDPESGSTLMEISKVLADDDFRRMKLRKCANPIVRDFWTKEAEKAGGEAALANMVPYITSKLTQFTANDMMRPIIAQQKSTINFRQVMDDKKILLINLSKGKIGETNSYLLGMVMVGKLLMAALSRADILEKDRKDFYLYIDEFQNVTTDSISQILSEARKYHLNLTIAHQFIGQLSEEISKAVFGNVGSMCSFRVGPEDGEFLEKQFEPIFGATDLVNTNNYHCFSRLLVDGQSTKPFNMNTYPPTEGDYEQAKLIKELSRLKYGRDSKMIEREIIERSQSRPVRPNPKGVLGRA